MNKLIQELQTESNKIGAQKSEAWLEWRKGRVTGTDMSKLFSKSNNNQDLQDLLLKKLGFERSPFMGNEMTDHGNFYEDVAVEKYEDLLLDNKVVLFNALPHKTCKHIGMSPDGIVFKEDETILIEIKCPFSRKIDEKISTGYKFQCQTGMEVLHSWGAPNIKTHFIQYKPKNHGTYSKNEIISLNIIERDPKIGKVMPEKANDFFQWVEDNKDYDFDGFLPE